MKDHSSRIPAKAGQGVRGGGLTWGGGLRHLHEYGAWGVLTQPTQQESGSNPTMERRRGEGPGLTGMRVQGSPEQSQVQESLPFHPPLLPCSATDTRGPPVLRPGRPLRHSLLESVIRGRAWVCAMYHCHPRTIPSTLLCPAERPPALQVSVPSAPRPLHPQRTLALCIPSRQALRGDPALPAVWGYRV